MERDVVVRWVVEAGRAELAALELWDQGATAIELQDHEGARATLVASFPTQAAARTVAARIGAAAEPVADAWRDAWKAHAEAIPVGTRLLVAPAWRPVPVAGGRLVVEIDSGACFGSGSHPSTRLVLECLAGEAETEPPAGTAERPAGTPPPTDDPEQPAGAGGDAGGQGVAGWRVLDVGTGSGILAVVAARLGAASVTALDVDPDAVAVARRNAERNGVADRVHVSLAPLPEVGGGFDLALVNVTAGVHAALGSEVTAALRPGGIAYLAGLLPGQWEHVAGTYAGCRLVQLLGLDGWAGAVLARHR